ncbi:MAG: RHS repeat-associated core domain-containing protein [Anaerosomatales bacterium]|nr:RHS repeat-associated core domain-containing protein [Anaerosomatales bacterium]
MPGTAPVRCATRERQYCNLSTAVTNPKDATTRYTCSADDLLAETRDALGHTWSFTHDAAGNVLSSRYPTGETVSRTYAADDLLATSTCSTGESYAFSCTPTHRLSSVTGTGGTFAFAYNPVGWLLSATDTAGGQSFVTTYAYDEAGNLFSMTRAGETYCYHLNARGDVVAFTDSRSAVVNACAYDLWVQPLSAQETVANPYRYASYRHNASTGLYCCWNRYCAPALARFLTRDVYPGELADPATMNPYLYCGGDPVNAVDPSGMMTYPGAATLFGGISLAAGAVGVAALGVVVGVAAGVFTCGAATPASVALIAGATSLAAGMIGEIAVQEAYKHREISPMAFVGATTFNKMSLSFGALGMAFGAPYAGYVSGAGSCMAGSLSMMSSDVGSMSDEQWELQAKLTNSDAAVWWPF